MDANEGTLLATPFDAKKLELMGAAVPVAEEVLQHAQAWPVFDIPASGRPVYWTGRGGDLLEATRECCAQVASVGLPHQRPGTHPDLTRPESPVSALVACHEVDQPGHVIMSVS